MWRQGRSFSRQVHALVMRRGSGWLPENYFMGDSLTLESVGVTLRVEEIYERV